MTHRQIGKQISKKRKLLGLTQVSFASQIGLTVDQLKKLEHGGKEIPPELREKIESVLGVIDVPESRSSSKVA